MTKMKTIVIGASGFLGSRIRQFILDQGRTVVGTSTGSNAALIPLHMEDAAAFDYQVVEANDTVIVAAAVSSPDVCERDEARARAINVDGTSQVITRAIDRGARVIFLSSDTVYGKAETAVDESSACRPLGRYAEMKREVEVKHLGNPQFKAVRLSYVFSAGDKVTAYLMKCAQQGNEAELYPMYRRIVYAGDVAAGISAISEKWNTLGETAVFNFGGPSLLGREDLAKELQRAFPTLRFVSGEPAPEFFSIRPRVIDMESRLLPVLLDRPATPIRDAVTQEFGLAG